MSIYNTPDQDSVTPESKAEQAVNQAREAAEKAAHQIGSDLHQAAENAQHTVNRAKENVEHTANQLGADAQKAAENAQQTVSQTVNKAKETAGQVGTDAAASAAEARRAMRESAYTVKEKASDSLLAAAENIRREALKGGNDDAIRQAQMLSRGMEKAALYLDSHTFDQISQDATEIVKDNPWQSVGIVFAVGLLLGTLLGGRRD